LAPDVKSTVMNWWQPWYKIGSGTAVCRP